MPTAATDDKVAKKSGPNSVNCQICQENVPHRVLRTHIGQHILRGHHIEGQAARSCANICGFCGARDECTIRLPLQSRSTRNRMVVVVSSCPSQPSAISWGRMLTATKANPCTNQPVICPQCTTTVWLYSMAAHFAALHPNDPIPPGLRVTEEEEASVRGWNVGALKSGSKRQKVAGSFHHSFHQQLLLLLLLLIVLVLLLLLLYNAPYATKIISYSTHATVRIGGHYGGGLSDTAIEVHQEVGKRQEAPGHTSRGQKEENSRSNGFL